MSAIAQVSRLGCLDFKLYDSNALTQGDFVGV